MLGLDTWVLMLLLVYSVLVTVGTDWLAGRMAGGHKRPTGRLWALFATLVWVAILFVASAIGVRYVERIGWPALGYGLLALVGFLVSLLRARLYGAVQEGRKPAPPLTAEQISHTIASILFASVLYLLVHWLFGRPVEPLLLIPLGLGTLLTHLDSSESLLGRLLPGLSRRLEAWLGTAQGWRSLSGALLVAVVTAPLLVFIPVRAWKLLPVGFVTHLIIDLFEPEGAMLLWPLRRTQYRVPGPPIKVEGGARERRLAAGLGLAAILLLFLVDFGPPPAPSVVVPSYEQSLDRYYGLRGRNLVFASVQGVWQTTGQWISGRFEILNARGTSYIMLDRYTGRIFTAGRNADDNLYLNHISLQTGDAATVKPAEVHLRDEALANALSVIYQMQLEPGLQHTYVSGELVLGPSDEGTLAGLAAESAPTDLERIEMLGSGGYRLYYLSAPELIALAALRVQSADLVIFATYASPASGPTVTPLPSPPGSGQTSP